jgi:hypothetical protein
MSATRIEIYALEEGDIIVYLGEHYSFIETTSAPDGTVRVMCSDEEGYRKCISVPDDFCTLWVLCDADHNEYA